MYYRLHGVCSTGLRFFSVYGSCALPRFLLDLVLIYRAMRSARYGCVFLHGSLSLVCSYAYLVYLKQDSIARGQPITVFDKHAMRDFTFIDVSTAWCSF